RSIADGYNNTRSSWQSWVDLGRRSIYQELHSHPSPSTLTSKNQDEKGSLKSRPPGRAVGHGITLTRCKGRGRHLVAGARRPHGESVHDEEDG
ncbi:hypothetical protein, partial [Saccharopolyspora hirsuta]|uniref:hypothetical protein n=1 Tax=Saccharopolyspora hirsuta TaxID=1837 RepID=UPI00331778A7